MTMQTFGHCEAPAYSSDHDLSNTQHPLEPTFAWRHHHPQILTMIVWRTVAGFSLARITTMVSIPDTRTEHFVKRNVKRQFFGPCESDFLWPSHENSSNSLFFFHRPLCVYSISEFEKVLGGFAISMLYLHNKNSLCAWRGGSETFDVWRCSNE